MKTTIGIGIALATLIGVAMAPACSDDGGGTLSIEEYFEQLDELENEADEKSNDLEEEFTDATENAEELDDIRDEFKDFIGEQRDLFEDFFNGAQDLNPPEEVQDAHDAAIEAFEDVIDEIGGLIETVNDADSFEDLDSPEFDAADERLTAACMDLEEVAADNDIDVDLNCEDE